MGKYTEDSAKMLVQSLLGKEVALRCNYGRNRIAHYSGRLTEMHPHVFVVEVDNAVTDRISCSYTDMVCGEIAIKGK